MCLNVKALQTRFLNTFRRPYLERCADSAATRRCHREVAQNLVRVQVQVEWRRPGRDRQLRARR